MISKHNQSFLVKRQDDLRFRGVGLCPLIPTSRESFLMDKYTNPLVAYSFRQLSRDYAGYCSGIRNFVANIPDYVKFSKDFRGRQIETQNLLGLPMTADDHLIMNEFWYDQSGNGNNATVESATNTRQIFYMDAGSASFYNQYGLSYFAREGVFFSDKPLGNERFSHAYFYNGNGEITVPVNFMVPSSNWTVAFVARVSNASGNNQNVYLTTGSGFNSNGVYFQLHYAVFCRSGANNTISSAKASSNDQLIVVTCKHFSDNTAIYSLNDSIGALTSSGAWVTGNYNAVKLGTYGNPKNNGLSLNGSIYEFLGWNTTDVDTESLANDLMDYYKISR